MSAPARLAAFAALLAALAAGGLLLGRASGVDVDDAAAGDAMGAHAEEETASPSPRGLALAGAGYRLELDTGRLLPGERATFTGRVLDEAGEPVADFDEHEGEPPLHLILVRRDLAGYLHLHPEIGADGTWRQDVTLPEPGVWRAYADFERDGEKVVLGTDVNVAGEYAPRALPAPADAAAADGYDVALDAGELRAGEEAELAFAVERAGRTVADFAPYLGARGHLVAIREGDGAYLHVHPVDDAAPEEIAFETDFDEPGRYRLFLQFSHGGAVRTAAFTVEVTQ